MDNHLLIVNNRSHYFEFDLTVEGLDDADAKVCFTILSKPFDMQFHCERVSGTRWGIELPKMGFMSPSTYTFTVTAVIDGYFFEAFRGNITVSKSHEVYVNKEDAVMKVESRQQPKPQRTSKPEPVEETTEVEPEGDNGRVVQPAANEGDNITRSQVHDIITRLTASDKTAAVSEAKTQSPEPEPKPEAKTKPQDDPLAEARRIASKLLKEEKKTGDSALAKTDNSKVKSIIREHKQKEAERKQRRQLKEQKQHEAAIQKTNAPVKKETPGVLTESVKKPDTSERDARARAVLESLSNKEHDEAVAAPAFKRSGRVVK